MPINAPTCEGTLTIGTTLMNRPAWAIVGDDQGEGSLIQLWPEFDVRGEDRLLPGANGVIPYRRRLTVTEWELRLMVVGDVDQNGNPTADAALGLMQNLEILRSGVFAPVASATGTRSATLTYPGMTPRTADIHVLGFKRTFMRLGRNKAIYDGKMRISIPAGRFS